MWVCDSIISNICNVCLFVSKDGLTSLLLSAKHAHAEVCSTLLDCGAEINNSDNSGRYELSQDGCFDSDNSGMTCKHSDDRIKTLGCWIGVARIINIVLLFYRTALMLASESNAVSVVDVLVHRGADLSAVDSQGHDIIHYAKLSGNSDIKTALTAALNKQQISGESHSRTLY